MNHVCEGAEWKARKGMVAVVEVVNTFVGDRWVQYRTYHVGLVESAYRCGHVKKFRGLETKCESYMPDWRAVVVDSFRLLDPTTVMDALTVRGSDSFDDMSSVEDWLNEVRGSSKTVRLGFGHVTGDD